MKLTYVTNARIPTEKAHGIHIMKMCEVFSFDHEVELITSRRLNKIKKDPFEYYGVARNFKIKKLPCLDLIPLDKYIGRLGFWIESLSFLFFLFPYILFKKTDITYTREKLILPLALFKKNIIFEAHTFPKNYFFYFPFLKKLKGIMVITQNLKRLFLDRGIVSDKILVAPDGVDLARFDIKLSQEECRKRLNFPQDKKIVLYTGHLYGWKGSGTLLEAAKKSPNFLFVFVGGTEKDIADFRKQAQGLSNVMIIGHRPHKEIPYWLKAADILVLPNSGKEEISKYWTSPLKMFEYMASNRPIIASDLASIREILNENNAVLIQPDDPEELARGINKILQDRNLAERISAQSYIDVQSYSWDKRVQNIFKFLSTK